MYEKIKEILGLCWRDDDRMDQETLFELQEKVADLLLQVAYDEGKQEECLEEFGWIYKSWYSVGGEEK